ncbi:glutathione S-transferase-like protein [Mycena vulgaris]|nr:glutathione S-transferase-like protein [Mycena vulgaris]
MSSTFPVPQVASSESDSPRIILHWLEKSRSQRILWLLEELGVPYEIKTHKRDPKTQFTLPELKSVHPLGKSPAITIGDQTLAESALIVEYLSEHFGPSLIPTKWKDGSEGKVGRETEEYMRYRYFMHYCEGSLMPLFLAAIISSSIESADVPLSRRAISDLSAKIDAMYLHPNFVTHFAFLEEQLATAPNGGPYLCGAELSGADIMMSFPVILVTGPFSDRGRSTMTKETHPKLFVYAELLKESESYKRAVEKIVALEGEYNLI